MGFFLTSGLFAGKWKRDGWVAYLKKRAVRLLTPWLCVNLLMLAPRYAAARLMGVEVHLTPGWVLMSFLDPHGQGIAPHLWFLPTLFGLWQGHPDPSQNVACDLTVRETDRGLQYVNENGPVEF